MVAALVALAWMVWLGYMVATVADPVVVSAPQLHYASLVIVGQVTPEGARAQIKVIKKLKDDLEKTRGQPLPEVLNVDWSPSYPKPGNEPFLLPLVRSPLVNDPSAYTVAQVPRPDRFLPAVVYVLNNSVRIQAERILGQK